MYARGGFQVTVIYMDQEFDKVVDLLSIVDTNTTAARQHVGKNERNHHTIKECACSVHTMLPYKLLPE